MNAHIARVKDWHKKFVVEERYVEPVVRRRLNVTSLILMVVGVVLFLTILVQVLTGTGIVHIDHLVETWFDQHRAVAVTPFMVTLAIVFGPTLLPVIIAIVIVIWIIVAKHVWRPLLLAGGMVLGVIIVETLAHIVGRTRPPLGLMLMGPDHTFSFPSGHVMGTANFLIIGAYLLISRKPTRRRIVIGAIVVLVGISLQIVSRLYLGYHWMSDTIASVCLALFMIGLVMLIDTWRTVRIPNEPVKGELSKRQVEGT